MRLLLQSSYSWVISDMAMLPHFLTLISTLLINGKGAMPKYYIEYLVLLNVPKEVVSKVKILYHVFKEYSNTFLLYFSGLLVTDLML